MADLASKTLVQNAIQVYQEGDYQHAARLFGEAAAEFINQGNELDAAEMKNNQSVALLQAGDASGAYTSAHDTARIFSAAGDGRREGMAYGNEAMALAALGRLDDATQCYRFAADVFGEAGEDQLRASVMQAQAGIQLRQGKVMQALLSMKIGIAGVKQPTLKQKILRALLRFLQ